MGTQHVIAGPGDPETWGPYNGHPNDPRSDETEERAYQTTIDNIWTAIRGNEILRTNNTAQCDEARLELADYLMRYLCDVEVTQMMEAYLSQDREKLFACFEEILESAIQGLADVKVAEDAHA